MMPTLATRLESVANIAIIVAAATLVGSWGHYYWNVTGPAEPPSYELGEDLADVPELSLETSDLTLLVYVNSGCTACTASVPFYSRLLRHHRESASIVRVAFVSREPVASLRDYLRAYQIGGVELISIPAGSSFRNIATPHLLLVKSNGEIVGRWLGKLAAPSEEIVIEAALRTSMPDAAGGDTLQD